MAGSSLPETDFQVCIVDQQYCFPTDTSLQLVEKKQAKLYEVLLPNCETPLFTSKLSKKYKNAFEARHRLFNADGLLVTEFYFEHPWRAVAVSPERKLFKCHVNGYSMKKTKLTATFTDILTGEERLVTLKADSDVGNAMMYLGEEKQGGTVLASVVRTTVGSAAVGGLDEYKVDVRAGVDVGLVVILCVTLDFVKDVMHACWSGFTLGYGSSY